METAGSGFFPTNYLRIRNFLSIFYFRKLTNLNFHLIAIFQWLFYLILQMKFSEFKKNIDAGIKTSLIEDESAERTKNLEIILNIINSINRSLVLEDVLELVLKNAIRLTNPERGFIVLKSPTGKLEFKLGLDSNNKELPEELFQVSSSVVEDVFYNGQSRFIEGAQSDAVFVPSKSIVLLDL